MIGNTRLCPVLASQFHNLHRLPEVCTILPSRDHALEDVEQGDKMAVNKHALDNGLCPKCGNEIKDVNYKTCGMCGQKIVWVKSSVVVIKRSYEHGVKDGGELTLYGVCLPGEEASARRILDNNQRETQLAIDTQYELDELNGKKNIKIAIGIGIFLLIWMVAYIFVF